MARFVELIVHQAKRDDIYTDTIRVHEDYRGGVPEGRICKVWVGDSRPKLFAMRGLPDEERGWIRLDELGRDRLGLKEGEKRFFKFEKASYWDAISWAAKASEPSARIATWIAIWSFALGILALLPSSDLTRVTPYRDQERKEASCELGIRHFYEEHSPGHAFKVMSSYDIELCMKSHGYRLNIDSPCPVLKSKDFEGDYFDQVRKARCYVPQGWLGRHIFFIEDRLTN